MTLSTLTDVLDLPVGRGAVAAFNVVHIEHAEAFAVAAERARCPVVMQISQSCVSYHGSLRPLAQATLSIAQSCTQPVVVQLDHATDPELVRAALQIGLTSVMFDGAGLPYAQNCAATAAVVQQAKALGISVEAELGDLLGHDGAHAQQVRTDPDAAAAFVAQTGVDALAVAVGSSHAMVRRTAALDIELIGALADKVPVPLVLHGSSGVPDAGLVNAVVAGIRKVNIATHINRVFTHALQDYLLREPTMDTRRYVGAARDAITQESVRVMELIGTRGWGDPDR